MISFQVLCMFMFIFMMAAWVDVEMQFKNQNFLLKLNFCRQTNAGSYYKRTDIERSAVKDNK